MAKQDYINILGTNALLIKAPMIVKGAVYDFLIQWIRNGCKRDMPYDYRQASGIVNQTLWERHKKMFLTIIEQVMPVLAVVYARIEKERTYFDKYRETQRIAKAKRYVTADKSFENNDVLSMRPHKSNDSELINPAFIPEKPANKPDGWVKGW